MSIDNHSIRAVLDTIIVSEDKLQECNMAVLVPFVVPINGGISDASLLLTKRAAHLNNHPSEISFPGGGRESIDDNLSDTALRESYEEVGLEPSQVDLLGYYRPMYTKKVAQVLPYIGWIEGIPTLSINKDEVETAFRVPLSYFCQDNLLVDTYIHKGVSQYLPRFVYKDMDIWGFTAILIRNVLSDLLDYSLDIATVPTDKIRVLKA